MSSIEAVTLDLWQTLVVDTREWGRLRTQIRIDDTVAALQEVGEQVTEEQVREAFRAGSPRAQYRGQRRSDHLRRKAAFDLSRSYCQQSASAVPGGHHDRTDLGGSRRCFRVSQHPLEPA